MKRVSMLFGSPGKKTAPSFKSADSQESYLLQSKTVSPSREAQSVLPDSGYYGLSSVFVEKISDSLADVSAVSASAAQVLAGYKFVDAAGALTDGAMPDNGAVYASVGIGEEYIIPEGYHNGSGKVVGTGGTAGTELNYAVVGGTEQPANPVENTVWVNTAVAISSYVFAVTQPENSAEGMVWIRTGTTAAAPFNAIKSNTLMVYPSGAYQYVDGAWTSVPAETYQSGAWVEWRTYLFNNGTINSELTGGIYYPTLEEDSIYFYKASVAGGTNSTYTNKKKIDLTDFRAVKARFLSTNTGTGFFFRIGVMEQTANGTSVTTGNMVANAREQGPFNGIERICELDISEIAGEYYLSYAFGVLSSSAAGNVNNRIFEWWLE